jgi:hypothetical protein
MLFASDGVSLNANAGDDLFAIIDPRKDTRVDSFFFSCRFFAYRFLYDGVRINDDDTPASLDMEDNGAFLRPIFVHFLSSDHTNSSDTIDVMVERELPSFSLF